MSNNLSKLTVANFTTEDKRDKKKKIMVAYVNSPEKIEGADYNFKSKTWGIKPKLILSILDHVGVGACVLRSTCEESIRLAEQHNNGTSAVGSNDPEGTFYVALNGTIVGENKQFTAAEIRKFGTPKHMIYHDGKWKPLGSAIKLETTTPPPPPPPAPAPAVMPPPPPPASEVSLSVDSRSSLTEGTVDEDDTVTTDDDELEELEDFDPDAMASNILQQIKAD